MVKLNFGLIFDSLAKLIAVGRVSFVGRCEGGVAAMLRFVRVALSAEIRPLALICLINS